MSERPFSFVRLVEGRKRFTHDLFEAIGADDPSRERWLVVSPHDDDAAIGGALWMQAAVAAGVDVFHLIVTDGRQGYCSGTQWLKIVQIRKDEAYEAYQLLGVPRERVLYVDYPDGALANLQGRHAAQPGEAHIQHYVGLQNAFTYHLRQIRPTRVLVPSPADLHPDHQITHNELMISLFHAGGDIWPELGEPIRSVPAVLEMAVYCDFAQEPNLGIRAHDAAFQKKLDAIAAFRSQTQIGALVEKVRQAGAVEFLHEVDFKFYSAQDYTWMFDREPV